MGTFNQAATQPLAKTNATSIESKIQPVHDAVTPSILPIPLLEIPLKSSSHLIGARSGGVVAQNNISPICSVANSTTRQFLQRCLLVIVQVFELYGFDSGSGVNVDGTFRTAAPLLPTLDLWDSQVRSMGGGERNAIKYVKWKLASFRAYWIWKSEHPALRPVAPLLPEPLKTAVPDVPAIIIGGRAQRWFKLHRKWTSERIHSFLATIRDAKKAMPRPTEALCLEEAVANRIKLTTAKDQPCGSTLMAWADVPEAGPEVEISLNVATAKKQLRRTVRELFTGKVYTAADRIKPLFPSTHSSFSSNRSKLGVVGDILRSPWFEQLRTLDTLVKTKTVRTHWAPNPKPLPKDKTVLIFATVRPYDSPTYVGPPPVLPQEVNEPAARLISPVGLRRNSPMTPSLKPKGKSDFGREPTKVVVDDTNLQIKAGQLWKHILDSAELEIPNVKVQVLPEALKMRPISKGPPYTYTVLKSLQKFLWRVMKDHPTFALIGKTVTSRDIFERMGKLSPGFRFLSGDYQAATDNFAPWVSETIVEELSDVLGLTPLERDLFLRAMTRHVFPGEGGDLPQKWGQLMGSIVSFPVLCLANACWCRWAEELDRQQVLLLSQTRLLVNGDDCLMMFRDSGRAAWRRITTFGGLQESVGKTFDSAEFCEINSQTFLYRPEQATEELWKRDDGTVSIRQNPYLSVPSVNLGLVYGMKRSGKPVGVNDIVSSSSRDKTISERHHVLFETCPPDLWPQVNKLFLSNHASFLRLMTKLMVPWFAPVWLGGLGLVGADSSKNFRIATGLVRDWAVLSPSERPSVPQIEAPWQIHDVVVKRLARIEDSKRVLSATSQAMSDKLYGLLCVETLFRQDVSAADMFREMEELQGEDDHASFRVANKHGKLWASRLTKECLPPYPDLSGPWVSDVQRSQAIYDALRPRTLMGWNVSWERTRVPDLRSLVSQTAATRGFVDQGREVTVAGGTQRLYLTPFAPQPTDPLRIPLIRDRDDPNALGLGLQ
jgi:hypothetical protein